MTNTASILNAIAQGDPHAVSQLVERFYGELQERAAQLLAREKPGQTLDATALVHEAFLRLFGPGEPLQFECRAHFFGAAAEAMRRILIESARRKKTAKRGGGAVRQDLDDVQPAAPAPSPDAQVDRLALAEIFPRFRDAHPDLARLVELHFFAGLTWADVARVLVVSLAKVKKDWKFARAWLLAEISRGDPALPPGSEGA